MTLPNLVICTITTETVEEDVSGSVTILLDEDIDSAREATAAVLEMLGYAVMTAANGKAGLEMFRQNRASIQLVITDMVMPHMSGDELFNHLRTIQPDLPVLVVTGYPLDDTGRRLLQDQKVAYMQKPFSIKELTETVQSMIDDHHRAQGYAALRNA